jgi:cell wall-associated NlpC family hydrolase
MQSDGNFVIYSSTLQPLWSTQTNGKGAAFAQIQNDGNFVLYTRTGWPVWYTGTKYYPSRMTSGILVPGQGLQSPDGTYTATFQLDGNFVLHGPKGLLWQSGTANIGVNKLAVQPDGNMVLYGNDAWKWQSYTPSIGSVFLQVQNDGNMVLYTSASRAVWASNTAGGNPSPSAAPADPKANLRQAVVNTAMAQLGKPYIFGASGPNAFDCSGLVEFAYRQNGLVYWPSRGTTKTIINYGINVKGQALLPGDLVWPNKDHVMMYIGNGRCVEAPAPGTVIKTSPMPANPYAVRRYI